MEYVFDIFKTYNIIAPPTYDEWITTIRCTKQAVQSEVDKLNKESTDGYFYYIRRSN